MSVVKTSYKQKFLLLAAGVLVLLLCSYYLSVQKTLGLRSEFLGLSQKSEDIESIHQDMARWQTLNASMDQKLGGDYVLAGFQESLLSAVGSYCENHDVVLAEFSKPFTGSEGGYEIETVILTLEGPFKALLQLVHHLETGFKGGRVSSVEFVKEKDYRKNKDELYLRLYVQNVRQDENKEE